jgi:ABC-2 type transport system permease protein
MCTMPPSRVGEQRRQATILVQVVDLFLIELTNWRWSWRSMVLTATITPLFSILGLGVFARDSGPDALAYVLTGNVVVSLMFGNMGNVGSHFTFMRSQGVLEYFAALPVRRNALILAVVLSFLVLSLPSLFATVILGSLVLGLRVTLHPLLFLVIPLCAISMSGVGALIGCSVRHPSQGGAINLLVTLVMTALGPVIIPASRLPSFMFALGRLSPATYAASAFRQTLLGPVTGQIIVDLAVLVAMAVVLFWLVGRTMDWRQR